DAMLPCYRKARRFTRRGGPPNLHGSVRSACYTNVSLSILRGCLLVNRPAQGRTSNTEEDLFRWTARGKSMSRNIVVLGAGMVGVSVAWHLIRRGHRVTLVDRREPGRETSFGNAGVIQREAVRPYGF